MRPVWLFVTVTCFLLPDPRGETLSLWELSAVKGPHRGHQRSRLTSLTLRQVSSRKDHPRGDSKWGFTHAEVNYKSLTGVMCTCKAYTTHTQVFLKGGLEQKQCFSAVSEITSIHTTHLKRISHDHSQTFYLNNVSSHLFSLLSIIVVSVIIVHLCLSKHRQYNIQSISVKTQIFQYHNIQLYLPVMLHTH